MPNLEISIDGAIYTKAEQIAMWEDIHLRYKCPECAASDSMTAAPRLSLTQNFTCRSCKTVFWTSPFRSFGAYPISREEPKQPPGNEHTKFIAGSKGTQGP